MDNISPNQTNPAEVFGASPPAPNISGGQPMVVNSQPQDKKASPKVVLIAVSVLLLAGLLFGLNKFTGLFSKAAGESCEPTGLQETNLTANSVEVVFQTDKACQLEVAYGTSNQPEALLLQVPEAMASLNHRFKLSPLLASTTYYYQVKAEGEAVGTIRSFLTLAASGAVPTVPPKPTTPAERPTSIPTTATGSASGTTYTFVDFQKYFGTDDKTFDINKDGVVNFGDWQEYQKTK